MRRRRGIIGEEEAPIPQAEPTEAAETTTEGAKAATEEAASIYVSTQNSDKNWNWLKSWPTSWGHSKGHPC